jgi:hypothetical protein
MGSLLPGTEVLARGLRWEVVSIQPAGDQEIHRLRCLDGALRGVEYDFLVPFERLEPITQEMDPTRAARLQHWRLYHQAFLFEQALGRSALLAAQPGRLRIAPYQLVPVMRVLHMSRPRLLIADGVGLGKTIEAGLILAELIARRRAHRILIVSPAGPLLQQWRREMRERFGLRFRVLDRDGLQDIRYATELGANPFDHEALGLTSIDFAKQEKVLQDLERTHYDVVVIDEAHHCAAIGGAGDPEDSLRRRLAEVLARQADGLLLLTATPHDGYDSHFASLLELLDPSLVDGRGGLRGEAFRRHVIRRLKRHIKDPETRRDLFPERRVLPQQVNFAPATHSRFAAFQQALLALVAPRLRQALRQRRYGEVLAFISLLKRSVSTVKACQRTVSAIAERLAALTERELETQEARRQRLRTMRDYRRRLARFGALSFEEEQDLAMLEAEDMAAELAMPSPEALDDEIDVTQRELRRGQDTLRRKGAARREIEALKQLAADAEPEDPKLSALLAQLQEIRAAEPGTNVLVYTEYADSQAAVISSLDAARQQGSLSGQVLAISGLDNETTREQVTNRFCTEDGLILVSTDATAEGLNLHERCHHLIHLELPYNPNRLEQRNGRIDRFGQKHEPIIRYLYLAGTFEERLLIRLISKYERQRKALSFVPNTLGIISGDTDKTAVRLLEGIADEQAQLFQTAQPLSFGEEQEDTHSEAYRELLTEIDRAFSGFEKAAKTFDWLGEAGLAADENSLREAERARRTSSALGVAHLMEFVLDAVRSDSADPRAVRQRPDGIWELRLPSSWTHGLAELPGYDPDQGVLLLTTELEQQWDGEGRRVGFLGRAHPLVRRALDRVRNLQLGSGDSPLDRRVSAARGEGSAPELLLTFLGRLESASGTELERVLTVRLERQRPPQVLESAEDWEHLADPERAAAPSGQWERHFRSWAPQRREEARAAALAAFEPLAREHAERHAEALAVDRASLEQWLRTRTEALCGPRRAIQTQLFEPAGGPEPERWRTLERDTERLAAFATDGAQPLRSRREAEGVLELYRRRVAELERRGRLSSPTVNPIGMLMLIPPDVER